MSILKINQYNSTITTVLRHTKCDIHCWPLFPFFSHSKTAFDSININNRFITKHQYS